MRSHLVAASVLFMLLGACKGSVAPQEQIKHLGVYAQTPTGVLELASYGLAESQDSIMEGTSVVFRFPDTEPQTARATAFFVNLPTSIIEDSEVYILPDPKAARWFTDKNRKSPTPIAADTENVGGSIYKVTPRSIPADSTGYLCLFVSMPPGSQGRLYAIKLSH